MTAPARTRTTASRSTTTERESDPRTTKTTRTGGSTRTRSLAAERAHARREDRRASRELIDRSPRQRPLADRDLEQGRSKAKQLQTKVKTSRVPLVISAMSLLGVGLVTTLWLSIATVGGSYEIQRGEMEVASLTEQKEELVRQNSSMDSTPALLRRATELGLGPGSPAAYLVQQQDGSTKLVGEPMPAPKSTQTPQSPKQKNRPETSGRAVEAR